MGTDTLRVRLADALFALGTAAVAAGQTLASALWDAARRVDSAPAGASREERIAAMQRHLQRHLRRAQGGRNA